MTGGVTRASGAAPPNVQAYWPGSGRSVTTGGSAILGLVLLERVEVDEPDLDHPAWVAPVQVDQVDHADDHESAHTRAHVGDRRGQRGGGREKGKAPGGGAGRAGERGGGKRVELGGCRVI